MDNQQFKSFKRKYLLNKRRHSNSREPIYLDKLKHLLRQAAELTVPPSQPEVESLQSQVSSLQSPAGQLNAALGLRLQSTPQTPPLGLAAPQTGARHQGGESSRRQPSASHQGWLRHIDSPVWSTTSLSAQQHWLAGLKNVLQSVESKRPFARARQRVALCILYITGWNVSKLLTLHVLHLKQLREFACSGELSAYFRCRLPLSEAQLLIIPVQEDMYLIIGDCSDNTPAFRAKYNSARPCTREGLTLELNQKLKQWNCSTKSIARASLRP